MGVFVWLWTCLGKTRLDAEELQSSLLIFGTGPAETRRCRSQAPRQVPWSKSSVFRPEAQVGPEGTMKVVWEW
jgi:hypothetical protein